MHRWLPICPMAWCTSTIFYQFDRPVVLHVEEELANPRAPGPVSGLFPEDVQQEADLRYQEIQAKIRRCRWVGMAWLAVVLVSLVLMIALPIGGRRGLALWVPAVILLGPLALLVRFVDGRCQQPGRWANRPSESNGRRNAHGDRFCYDSGNAHYDTVCKRCRASAARASAWLARGDGMLGFPWPRCWLR